MKRLLVFCFTAASLYGSIIIDNGPPNDNSNDIVDSSVATSFSLTSPATVEGVNFWYQAQFETDLPAVSYAFYNNANGALGPLLANSLAIPAESVDTNAYFASISVPDLSLPTGTYWMELHAGSTLTDTSGFTVWWAATDTPNSLLALSNPGIGLPNQQVTQAGFEQYAFQLTGSGGAAGSPVPEPASALLMASALAALILAGSILGPRDPPPLVPPRADREGLPEARLGYITGVRES